MSFKRFDVHIYKSPWNFWTWEKIYNDNGALMECKEVERVLKECKKEQDDLNRMVIASYEIAEKMKNYMEEKGVWDDFIKRSSGDQQQ